MLCTLSTHPEKTCISVEHFPVDKISMKMKRPKNNPKIHFEKGFFQAYRMSLVCVRVRVRVCVCVFQLLMPALMVTAGKDPVLPPASSKGMEDMVRNTQVKNCSMIIIDYQLLEMSLMFVFVDCR